MTTLAEQLDRAGGRPSGFDYLRICLASGVLIWHSMSLSYGPQWAVEATSGVGRGPVALPVPMFFAVSGFLVAASLSRNSALTTYLALRGLRIIPALSTEVVLSALILGPICTTLPLAAYFASPGFTDYFLNIAGIIHYQLPGVFESNPFPKLVNGQLWTVPFEYASYAILGVLGAIGLIKNRWLFLAAVLCAEAVALSIHLIAPHPSDGGIFGAVNSFRIVHIFFAAAVLFVFRDRVRMSFMLFLASAIITLALLVYVRPTGAYFISFPLAYATIYLGLLNPPKNALIAHGDFSYGIYLYGTPIEQFVVSWGAWTHHLWIVLAIAGTMTALLAIGSWFLIEKPALGLRRFLARPLSARTAASNPSPDRLQS
ncbi:MAG: acyltransferase [Hyphomonadaceae bacterium]|nr:acyltransferase [Hyphomonadaceae bacterium]